MKKSIVHFFENHMQYGDLQLGYNNFPSSDITFKDLKRQVNDLKDEDDLIAG